MSAVKLTELTPAGGCAAKYSAARLEELLRGFVPVEAENLLIGLSPADDDLLALHRVPILGQDSLADFICRLRTARTVRETFGQ